MVVSEKLQKGLMTTLASISVPIIILNILGGFFSGIWLAILGEWRAIIQGVALIVVSGSVVSFALMPGLLFAAPGMMAIERGKKILGAFFSLLSVLYTYALMTIWCIGIMWFFVRATTDSSTIPLLIWSYGVALAPWVWLAKKDQQAGGNEFSILATFFAQISYVLAMVMFFLSVSLSTIAIVFGIIMLVAAILQNTIVWHKEIQKSFSKKEVKEAHRILEEENDKWVFGGFELVKSNIEKTILSHPKQFMDVIRKGRPVREFIYSVIANTSGDMLESGQYNIRRGVLNPIGPGEELLNIFNAALDELVILGDMDEEYAQEQKWEILKSIRDAG